MLSAIANVHAKKERQGSFLLCIMLRMSIYGGYYVSYD